MYKRYAIIAAVFVAWLVMFYFLSGLAGLDLTGSVSKANPVAIVLSFLLYFLAISTGVFVLYRCLKAVGLKPPIKGIYKAWLFGSFVDNIVPTLTPMGEASMAYFMEKFYRVSYTKSLAAIGMYVSAWGLSISLFSTLSLVLIQLFVGLQTFIPPAAIFLLVIAVLIFIGLTAGWFLLITNRGFVERMVCRIVPVYNKVYNAIKGKKLTFEYCVFKIEFEKAYTSLELFMKNKKEILTGMLLFVVPQLTHIFCLYFLLLGFGVEVSFFAVLLIHIVSSVAGLISFIPSGMGIYEVVSSGTLGMSVPSDIAVAAIFIYRLIFVWTTNLLGGAIGILQGIEQPGKVDKVLAGAHK